MNTENKLSNMEAYEKALLKMNWINLVGLALMLVWVCIAIFAFDSVNMAYMSLIVLAVVPGMTSALPMLSAPSTVKTQTAGLVKLIFGFVAVVMALVLLKIAINIPAYVYAPVLIASIAVYVVLLLITIKKLNKNKAIQLIVDERMKEIQKNSFFAGLIGFFVSVVILMSLVPSMFSDWLFMNRNAYILLFWVGWLVMMITQSAAFIIMYKRGE